MERRPEAETEHRILESRQQKERDGEPAIAYSKFVGSAANEYARKHLLTVTVSAEVLSHVLSTVDPLYGASLYDLNGDPVLLQQENGKRCGSAG